MSGVPSNRAWRGAVLDNLNCFGRITVWSRHEPTGMIGTCQSTQQLRGEKVVGLFQLSKMFLGVNLCKESEGRSWFVVRIHPVKLANCLAKSPYFIPLTMLETLQWVHCIAVVMFNPWSCPKSNFFDMSGGWRVFIKCNCATWHSKSI